MGERLQATVLRNRRLQSDLDFSFAEGLLLVASRELTTCTRSEPQKRKGSAASTTYCDWDD
jgi:hypothetical protein